MPERDDIITRLTRLEATLCDLAEEARALREKLAQLGFPAGHRAAAASGNGPADGDPGAQGQAGNARVQPPVLPARTEEADHQGAAGRLLTPRAGEVSAPRSEGGRGVPEAGHVLPQSAAASKPNAASDEAGEIVIIINRKRVAMTQQEINALNPIDFDLFLDDVRGLVGGRTTGGGAAVRPAAIGLQPTDLYVLRRLMERQGFLTTGSEFPEIGDPEKNRRAVANHIYRLRKALGDDARDPRLILRGMNSHSVYTKGVGVSLAPDIRCCLVTFDGRASGRGTTR